MIDSEFINDAVEGLQDFKHKEDLTLFVVQLNENLNKQLENKKRRKDKRKLKDQPWVLLAVVLIILLTIVCFMVIKKFLES